MKCRCCSNCSSNLSKVFKINLKECLKRKHFFFDAFFSGFLLPGTIIALRKVIRKRSDKMTEILIASHGHFASGLKSSIEILTGMSDQIKTIDAYVDQTDYTGQIKDFIKTAKRPAVIFTDLKGGSVNQKVVLAAANEKEIYVVTQTNLAVVMSVLLDSEKLTKNHLEELIQQSQVELFKLDEQKQNLAKQETDFFE